jgi:DNA-directed RNA polymerase specialized sigma24 family protein
VKGPGPDVLGRPVGFVVPPEQRQPIVTAWAGPKDFDNAPPSYEAYFRQYLDYTRWLVNACGYFGEEIDDVVSEIMIRFWERDSLGVFRRDWNSRSKSSGSVFRSYYSRFVVTYAKGKRRNVANYRARNLLLCDARSSDDDRPWIEKNCSTDNFEASLMEDLDFQDLIQRISDEMDASLYDAMVAFLELADARQSVRAVGVDVLSRRLGVSRGEARKLLLCLRETITRVVADKELTPSVR